MILITQTTRLFQRFLNIAALGLLLSLGLSTAANAGQACEEKPLTTVNVRNAIALGANVFTALNQTDAQVALIARVGSDLSKYNLRYSHVGIAWRDNPKGKWLVTHLLNRCGTAESSLYNEGLANFFADDMFAWEAQIIVPKPDLQVKLAKVLTDNSALNLHEPRYNMLAFPFSTKYANSNQWVLETLAMAASERVYDRGSAQAWLKTQGYQASTLEIGTFTRLGARMTKANIAFDDHPTDRRMAGKIDTITVESIQQFLTQKSLVQSVLTQSLNAGFSQGTLSLQPISPDTSIKNKRVFVPTQPDGHDDLVQLWRSHLGDDNLIAGLAALKKYQSFFNSPDDWERLFESTRHIQKYCLPDLQRNASDAEANKPLCQEATTEIDELLQFLSVRFPMQQIEFARLRILYAAMSQRDDFFRRTVITASESLKTHIQKGGKLANYQGKSYGTNARAIRWVGEQMNEAADNFLLKASLDSKGPMMLRDQRAFENVENAFIAFHNDFPKEAAHKDAFPSTAALHTEKTTLYLENFLKKDPSSEYERMALAEIYLHKKLKNLAAPHLRLLLSSTNVKTAQTAKKMLDD